MTRAVIELRQKITVEVGYPTHPLLVKMLMQEIKNLIELLKDAGLCIEINPVFRTVSVRTDRYSITLLEVSHVLRLRTRTVGNDYHILEEEHNFIISIYVVNKEGELYNIVPKEYGDKLRKIIEKIRLFLKACYNLPIYLNYHPTKEITYRLEADIVETFKLTIWNCCSVEVSKQCFDTVLGYIREMAEREETSKNVTSIEIKFLRGDARIGTVTCLENAVREGGKIYVKRSWYLSIPPVLLVKILEQALGNTLQKSCSSVQ